MSTSTPPDGGGNGREADGHDAGHGADDGADDGGLLVDLQLVTGTEGDAMIAVATTDMVAAMRHLVEHVHVGMQIEVPPGSAPVPVSTEEEFREIVGRVAETTAMGISQHLKGLVDQLESSLIMVVSQPDVAAVLAGGAPPEADAQEGDVR